MEPVEFLQRVLPSQGLYCVAEFDTKRKQHKFVKTIEDMLEGSNEYVQQKLNTYFALGSFIKDGTRTAANVSHMRSLFIDVDCGSGKYATKKEAFLAIRKFLKDTELDALGSPIVVDSGGGIHVYWPMDRDIPASEWLAAARNLKKLCTEQGFKIDQSVTGDAARVLRMPGSYNFNYVSEEKPDPVPCAIKAGGDTVFNFEQVADAIKSKLKGHPAVVALDIPGVAPKKKQTTFKLSPSNGSKFQLLLDKTNAGSGCHQLKHYIEHATEDGMEPLWRALLSWSMKCEDGEQFNKYLSDLHPYDEDRMHNKLREIKGPYPCAKMEDITGVSCNGCPHKGKITNPLVLANYIKKDEGEKEILLEEPEVTNSSTNRVSRPPAPKGYSYAEGGGIIKHGRKKDDDEESGDVKVLDYDLFVVNILCEDNVHTVYMVADRKFGAETIRISQSYIVSKTETLKALAASNIMAMPGQSENLYYYVSAAIGEASRTNPALVVPKHYGWQGDGSFVLNEKIYHPDGKIVSFPMPSLEGITAKTKPSGNSMHPWLNLANILINREEWMLLGLGMTGAASVLMRESSVAGMVFHACGKTNSGKTLALNLGTSMWGTPSSFVLKASSSVIAVCEFAAAAGSLLVGIDESTTKQNNSSNPKNANVAQNMWAQEIIYDFSEGNTKDRSTVKGGLQKNSGGWKSLLFTTSNSYLMDSLAAQDKSSEPLLLRMLEAQLKGGMPPMSEEERLQLNELAYHNGIVGPHFIQWLVQNWGTAEGVRRTCRKRLVELFGENPGERFWMEGLSALAASWILFGSKYANIIDLPVKVLFENCAKPLLETGRSYIGLCSKSADDVLNSYTRERYGQLVVVRKSDASKMFEAVLGNDGVIDQTISRSHIAGRVEHDVTPGRIDYYIEIKMLRQHCAAMGFSFEQFKKDMEQRYHVEYLQKKDLLSKTKGPEMRVAAMRISVPDNRLEEAGD